VQALARVSRTFMREPKAIARSGQQQGGIATIDELQGRLERDLDQVNSPLEQPVKAWYQLDMIMTRTRNSSEAVMSRSGGFGLAWKNYP
jgi:hypothetical protein